MKKQLFILIAIILTIMSTTALADIIKGQKTYLKKCKICHDSGTKGASMKTQSKWVKLFDNNSKKMIEVHDYTEAKEYFHGNKFKKKSTHLKDFLWKYGSDSGNVPSCN